MISGFYFIYCILFLLYTICILSFHFTSAVPSLQNEIDRLTKLREDLERLVETKGVVELQVLPMEMTGNNVISQDQINMEVDHVQDKSNNKVYLVLKYQLSVIRFTLSLN